MTRCFCNLHCTKNEVFRKLRIWSTLQKKSLMENFIFFTVPDYIQLYFHNYGCQLFSLISLTLFSVGLTDSYSKIINKLAQLLKKISIMLYIVVSFHILICCLNLSKEFRFSYRFGTMFHIILPLKHSACVPYCVVFVLDNLSRLLWKD